MPSHPFLACPKCKADTRLPDGHLTEICPGCGLVFAKFLEAQTPPSAEITIFPADTAGKVGLWNRLIAPPADDDQLPDHDLWWARAIGLILLCIWGGYFITMNWRDNQIGMSFMHHVNLVFHEAGHVIFIPFGHFMTILGGSLFQVLWPLILSGAFLLKYNNPFAASVCLAWAGQSLMDVAPYIGDARALQLPLIGEYSEDMVDMRADRHDWHNILGDLGWLAHDQQLATLAHVTGSALTILAMLWAGLIVRAQYQQHKQA
ncbi:Trm112 family protein [Leeia oryzae]|uniref:Trm112 family protein n=1 Tax=Leeia oryzae TaxID=356662 RepID=UPI00037839B7|nr:Trm112 family protein [Leeia oryzae]